MALCWMISLPGSFPLGTHNPQPAATYEAEANARQPGGRNPARVHDFRHSFAVGSLLRWYQQGADVQSNLPKFAMYMGHVSIVSTAYYLRWIPQLAAAASHRLETHFGHLITGGAA